MKKIGIITFHDGINYGTFLQCFSLQSYLTQEGHDVTVINYKSFENTIKENKCTIFSKYPVRLFKNIKKFLYFKSLNKYRLHLSKRFYSLSDQDLKNFDCIIFGSDEIWNFKHPLFGFDPTYFGAGFNKKLISYAPSFGQSSSFEIPETIIKSISKFHSISVRDQLSKSAILNKVKGNIEIVLDPTFLIDLLSVNNVVEDDMYEESILVYSNQNLNPSEFLSFSELEKYETISVSYKNSYCNRSIFSPTINEFLNIFKNSNFIITDTFHGCVFSLIFNKQFMYVPNKNKSNKITSLLKLFDLDRDIIFNQSYKSNYRIDYNKVNVIIEDLKSKSKLFLQNSIKF